MSNLLSLLSKVRQNPNMYLGKPSLDLLFAFITGCICYQNELNNDFIEFPPGFQTFVQGYYNKKGNVGWKNIIQEEVKNDDEAFFKFFDLFDVYLIEH